MKLDPDMQRLIVCAALVSAARRWRDESKRSLSSLCLSEACARPLLIARRLGEPVNQATLAQMAGVKGPSLVRLLDQLVDSSLVKRIEDPEDRRANSIIVTSRGLDVAREAEARLLNLRKRALARFSEDELESAIKVLRAFADIGREVT